MDLSENTVDDGSIGECLICLSSCDTLSSDLFLYTCECIYLVHPNCFKEWRSRANNNIICLICRIELEPFYEDQRQLVVYRDPVNQGLEERMETFVGRFCRETVKNIFTAFIYVSVIVYVIIFFRSFFVLYRFATA